jgi:hypothetical protein
MPESTFSPPLDPLIRGATLEIKNTNNKYVQYIPYAGVARSSST